ncbi:meiosis arrest female protein 1-like protein [Tanacetum coccineum]
MVIALSPGKFYGSSPQNYTDIKYNTDHIETTNKRKRRFVGFVDDDVADGGKRWPVRKFSDEFDRVATKKGEMMEVRIKTFDAYGDTVQFNEYKTQWGYTGITMVDVPAKKNAADSKLMLDIFKFVAFNVRPPAYIMLISGDRDFTEALKSLNNLGFITILIYPDGCVSPEGRK